jgi:hypothetical protein
MQVKKGLYLKGAAIRIAAITTGKGSSCLLHNTLNQSLNSRPKMAFFAGALKAIGNSWGRSRINLLHRGAVIKIVDFSNSTKRPVWPSFDFNTAGSITAAMVANEIVKTSFFEPPLRPLFPMPPLR